MLGSVDRMVAFQFVPKRMALMSMLNDAFIQYLTNTTCGYYSQKLVQVCLFLYISTPSFFVFRFLFFFLTFFPSHFLFTYHLYFCAGNAVCGVCSSLRHRGGKVRERKEEQKLGREKSGRNYSMILTSPPGYRIYVLPLGALTPAANLSVPFCS